MPEQQKNYDLLPEEVKIEEVGADVRETEETKMLSIKDLDDLLLKSEGVITNALTSEEEVDRLIEKRQESLDRLRDVENIQESRLQIVENYNPLNNLRVDDYERLVQEKIMDSEYAERLKKVDNLIAKFESLEHPSAGVKTELKKLLEVQTTFRKNLESQIEEQQEELSSRREATRNRVLEHYGERIKELTQTITDIESNPYVLEKLETIARKEMEVIFAQKDVEKKAFDLKIEQERKVIVEEAGRYVQSLGMRHANAFKRLGHLLANEKIAEELIQILEEEDKRKQQGGFDRTRGRLVNIILKGEGEMQLKEPKEVVPWIAGPTSIRYKEAIHFLRFQETEQALRLAAEAGNEQAKKQLKQLEQILIENEVLRKLFGPQWVTDHRTNQKKMGMFWSAFETRKKNDQEDISMIRKAVQEEIQKNDAVNEKSIEEIVERGGFRVKMPVTKEVNGKKVIIGEQSGAIRLEKAKSKKGNEYWKVVEVSEKISGVSVGDTSPLDMCSFPEWLRELAKMFFVMEGKELIERLLDSQ